MTLLEIPASSLVLVCDDEIRRTRLTLTLRTALPGAAIRQRAGEGAGDPNAKGPEVAVVWAVSNADFRRIAALHRACPQLPIIAMGDRDRSASAYMAGASEYVTEHDTPRLVEAIGLCCAARDAG